MWVRELYEGSTFKIARFEEYLAREALSDWPLTEKGQIELKDDTLREMAKVYPQLTPLRKLRGILNDLQSEDIKIGADGRNRTPLWPYKARTGRNAPSGTEFILNRGAWMRNLIQPRPGYELYYVDWVCQEVVIAAALSGDTAMLEAARTGDPYLELAIRAGDAPAGATKATHREIRDIYKVALLGSFYGMQPQTLARQLGTDLVRSAYILRQIAEQFPVFWAWARRMEDVGQLTGRLVTRYGWQFYVHDGTRSTTVRNFSVQANGAEMLRLAAYYAVQAGVKVCALLHDALLVEAPAAEGAAVLAATRAAMDAASAAVLDGEVIATDVPEEQIIRYPARFPAPQETWQTVLGLLGELS